jgi:hypothetical protein
MTTKFGLKFGLRSLQTSESNSNFISLARPRTNIRIPL